VVGIAEPAEADARRIDTRPHLVIGAPGARTVVDRASRQLELRMLAHKVDKPLDPIGARPRLAVGHALDALAENFRGRAKDGLGIREGHAADEMNRARHDSAQMAGVAVVALGTGMERNAHMAYRFRIDRIRDRAALRRDVAVLHLERLVALDQRPASA
jgi:hypothetical protein